MSLLRPATGSLSGRCLFSARTSCRSCAPYSRRRYSRPTSNPRYQGFILPAWQAPTSLDPPCGSCMVPSIRLDASPATLPTAGVVWVCVFPLGPVAPQRARNAEPMERLNELHEMLHASPPASDAAVPVLVLKVGRYILHHGAVGIIRSLGSLGVPVYSVVEDRFTPAAVSRYLTGALIWETRGLDGQQLLEGMALIGERLNRPTIVIPTDDVAAIFIAEQAATLQRWFLFPQQPPMLPRTLANKRELYLLCRRIGVPCPETAFPSSIDDVREFVEHAALPVVVKASEAWLLPENARTTSIVQTPEEACAIYRQRGPHLIFQEYIPPARGEDWFYHGYRTMRPDCCVGLTGRKLGP